MTFSAFSLNEAERFAPEELKAKLKADPDLNILLKKDAKFSDIENPASFLSTTKRVFLNNPEIVKYVKDTKSFSEFSWDFSTLRKLKPEDFNESHFQTLQELVLMYIKQVGRREKLTLSTSTKKSLEEWINTSGRYNRSMSRDEIDEIDSIPGLKPDKPIKLYRGLMWSKHHMTKDREGRKFVESIRKGTDVVDYIAEKPESWTFSKGVAYKFATAGPANSQFSAMLNWMSKGSDAIEGDLGVIIAILAKPETILADLSKVGNKLNTTYEWEYEVILKPGTYTAKIVTMYDKKGEITPQEFMDRLEKGGDRERDKMVDKFVEEFVPKINNLRDKLEWISMDRNMFDAQKSKSYLDHKDEILSLYEEWMEWMRKMKFDTAPPEKTAASTDQETIAYELFSRLYGFGRRGNTVLPHKATFEEVLAKAYEERNDRTVTDELNSYLRWRNIIKKTSSSYKPETLKPFQEKVLKELTDAVGTTEDKGLALARELMVLRRLWVDLDRIQYAVEK